MACNLGDKVMKGTAASSWFSLGLLALGGSQMLYFKDTQAAW